ncbi:hypothetical protein BD626DRAFT_516715 [Schizophyllum amplum]|uniref:Uncharacterized protein n=1 Tax=Schizophyllum amplum TaxID=97359 RepID=A0A550BWU1_9AGAR|nr:hypothetical protein BD626DRAFT_516715 [Auriculariopsis ampla]
MGHTQDIKQPLRPLLGSIPPLQSRVRAIIDAIVEFRRLLQRIAVSAPTDIKLVVTVCELLQFVTHVDRTIRALFSFFRYIQQATHPNNRSKVDILPHFVREAQNKYKQFLDEVATLGSDTTDLQASLTALAQSPPPTFWHSNVVEPLLTRLGYMDQRMIIADRLMGLQQAAQFAACADAQLQASLSLCARFAANANELDQHIDLGPLLHFHDLPEDVQLAVHDIARGIYDWLDNQATISTNATLATHFINRRYRSLVNHPLYCRSGKPIVTVSAICVKIET